MRELLSWYKLLTTRLKVVILVVFSLATVSAFIEYYLLENVGSFLTAVIGGTIGKLRLIDGTRILLIVWIAALIRVLNVFMVGYSASSASTDILKKLFNNMSKHPLFVGRINKSEFNAALNEQASDLTWQCIRPTISIINDFIVTLGLIFAIIEIDAESFAIVALALSAAYLVLVSFVKSKQKVISKNINRLQISVASETSNHYNNIILLTKPKAARLVEKGLYKSISNLRRNQFLGQFFTLFPKYFIETIGITLLLTFLMVPSNNPDTNPLANTGVIAVGAQRLLPIFQQMYAAYSSVNNSKELISKINYRLKAKLDYKTDKIFDDIDNEIGIDSLQISSSGKNYLNSEKFLFFLIK